MPQFNIRVYGILINELNQVLVSDELIRGNYYTKFPGGGLEFGEGTRDCLVREFKEELNLDVRVEEHLYTTDFFQMSAFHPDHQIISIYYKVTALDKLTVQLAKEPFEKIPMSFQNPEDELVCFRFIDWENLSEETVSLPIDKIVVRMLKETD
jgi:ADP-ribose pyrophosphatase YjhB (NUDIX family)